MAGIDEYHYWKERETDKAPIRNEQARVIRPMDLGIKPYKLDTAMEDEEDVNAKKDVTDAVVLRYVEPSVGIATVITRNLLSHPFVVLRRQCQVQPHSNRRHLIPITLIPVVVRLHQLQGVTTLWKGLGSCLLVRGMTMAVEDILTKFTVWPKSIPEDCSLKSYGQHILLKCVGLAVLTPFYSASLVETVQSDIASEKPGLLDVFKEGLCRVIGWGSPARGRMLPVWALIGPTVLHGIIKYIIEEGVTYAAEKTICLKIHAEQSRQGALRKVPPDEEGKCDVNVAATASFIGLVTAEVLCYPLETILHRLHLQGTRTIVDNLDSGSQVVAILTGYGGAIECYSETVAQEGVTGLYKGFGALIAQFAVHWAVIRITRAVVAKCASLFRSQTHPPRSSRLLPTTPSQMKATTPISNKPSWIGEDYPTASYSHMLKPVYLVDQK